MQIAQLESEAAEKDAAITEKEAAIKALEAGGTAEAVKAICRPLIRRGWRAMADIVTMAKDELRANGKARRRGAGRPGRVRRGK